MRKIILICLLLISAIGYGQSVVQRASLANTVDDPNAMNSRMHIIPRFYDTLEANTKYPNLDSAGKIIYTRSDKAFWYRQDNPKKWVKVVSGNNLSSDFFYDSTCNCYKIDTTALIGIINNYYKDSSIISISILNDSTLTICYPSGCVNIGITTTINNISSVYWLGGDSISVCAIDTTGGVVTTVCDTIAIGTQPNSTVYQNWLRNTGSDIIEFGSNRSDNNDNFLSHDTYTNTSYYRMFWDGYAIYDYNHQFRKQENFGFPNGTGVVSFLHPDGHLGYSNDVRIGVNYTGDTVVRSPFIAGYFGTGIGYSIGTNWQGHGSYGAYLDNNNSKTTGLFFHTFDSTTTDGVTIYAAPDLGGTAPVLNGQLKNYRVTGFKTDLSLQHYGYGSGSSFITSDTTNKKPLAVDANGNMYRMSSWFGGGTGNDSAFVYLETTSDTSYNLLRSDRSIPPASVTLRWAAGDKNQIHVESWDNLSIVANTIDSSQLKVTGVTEGTYTNPTIRVNDRGQVTSISNGSGGGSTVANRYLQFQVGVSTYAPSSGATYCVLPSGYDTLFLVVAVEGKTKVDTTNGVVSYQWRRSNDTLYFSTPLADSARVQVWAYLQDNWTVDVLPPPAGYDPAALAYFSAVEGDGGTITSDQKAAINSFYLNAKSNGYYDSLDYVHIQIFDTHSKYNLISPLNTDAAYRATYVNSPTFSSSGVTLNGTNQYVNPHWIGGASTRATDISYLIAAYETTTGATAGTLWGVAEAANSANIYMYPYMSGNIYWRTNNTAQVSTTASTGAGFFIGSTVSAGTNSKKLYRDGTQIFNLNDNGSGATLPDAQSLTFGAYNNNAVIQEYRACTFWFDAGGKGLSPTKVALFNSDVQSLKTSLGL